MLDIIIETLLDTVYTDDSGYYCCTFTNLNE